jgi:hypothetical protein
MTYKPTSGASEPGTKPMGQEDGLQADGEQHSDLQDRRNGAFDRVTGKSPEPLKEHTTPHQAAQWGADVRPETEPSDEGVPEGLRREPKHPLNPTDGRGDKPAHLPEWNPGKETQ